MHRDTTSLPTIIYDIPRFTFLHLQPFIPLRL